MRFRLLAVAVLVVSTMVAAEQDRDATVYSPSRDSVSVPTLVRMVAATYTPEAKAAQIVGWVTLDLIVRPDGTISDVKVSGSCLGRVGAHREPNGDPFRCATADERAKGVDPINRGLDQQAVNAAKQWVYKPGMKDGKPVAVRILAKLHFDPSDSK